MGHDFGSLFAFYLDKKYPNYLESIVALDATPFKPKLNFKQTAVAGEGLQPPTRGGGAVPQHCVMYDLTDGGLRTTNNTVRTMLP